MFSIFFRDLSNIPRFPSQTFFKVKFLVIAATILFFLFNGNNQQGNRRENSEIEKKTANVFRPLAKMGGGYFTNISIIFNIYISKRHIYIERYKTSLTRLFYGRVVAKAFARLRGQLKCLK